MFSYNNLKKIAQYKINRNSVSSLQEFEDFLLQWWSDKYKLPTNHPLLLDRYIEELLIEYYTDYFRSNPKELNDFERENGIVVNNDDEEWFKKAMGKDYTTEQAFSNDYISQPLVNKGEVIFEDDFKVLGD